MALLFSNYYERVDWTKGYEHLEKEMLEISEVWGEINPVYGGLVRLPPVQEVEYRVAAHKLNEEVVKMALVSDFEIFAKQEGVFTFALSLLDQRFGPLEPELSPQLEKLTTDRLQALSKDDLKTWLKNRA